MVLFIVDYLTDPAFLWSFTVGLVIIYVNVALRLTILGKSSYMAKIIWTIIIGMSFLIEADLMTGNHGWGVNFAIPTALLACGVIIGDSKAREELKRRFHV